MPPVLVAVFAIALVFAGWPWRVEPSWGHGHAGYGRASLRLRITRSLTMLTTMCALFRAHSRSFRGLLAVTLLAWAMLAFGAFVRPFTMDAVDTAIPSSNAMTASSTMSAMSTHCDDMSPQTHPSVPAQPMNGHDCCHGGCYCSSSCAGLAGAPPSLLAWQPAHGPVIRPIYSQPGLTPAAPPLPPPIV